MASSAHVEASGAHAIVEAEGVEVRLVGEVQPRGHGPQTHEPQLAIGLGEQSGGKPLPRRGCRSVGGVADAEATRERVEASSW